MAVSVAAAEQVHGDRPPDALTPPPGNPRFPLLDSVRAVAALAVVLTHVTLLSSFNFKSGGEYTARLDSGVALFFVLSGFLLYRPFVSARQDGRPRPPVRSYTRRRILRIVPAYWLALTVLSIWPGLTDVWHAPWRYYFFLQWTGTRGLLGGLVVAWSLCIEVFFYLALPFYAMAADRWLRGRDRDRQARLELAALVGISILSVASRQIMLTVEPHSVYQETLPAFLYWFALGMGMAVVSAWFAHRSPSEQPRAIRVIARHPGLPWALAAVSLWAVSTRFGLPRGVGTRDTGVQWLAEHVLYGLTAALFTIPAIFGTSGNGWPRRILANRFLAWIGLISYGIFLWHLPIAGKLVSEGALTWLSPIPDTIVLLALTLAIAGSIAALSYYILERPILRLKETQLFRRRGGGSPSASRSAQRRG